MCADHIPLIFAAFIPAYCIFYVIGLLHCRWMAIRNPRQFGLKRIDA